MIREQEVIRGAEGSHPFSYAGSSGIIILLHRAGRARPLKIIADVGRRHAAHHALDTIPIPIVNKRGAGRPADRGHAVLGIIGVTGGAAGDLLRHVAVGVVTEDCAPRARHSSLILRPQLLDATVFYLLTFKTVSTHCHTGLYGIFSISKSVKLNFDQSKAINSF